MNIFNLQTDAKQVKQILSENKASIEKTINHALRVYSDIDNPEIERDVMEDFLYVAVYAIASIMEVMANKLTARFKQDGKNVKLTSNISDCHSMYVNSPDDYVIDAVLHLQSPDIHGNPINSEFEFGFDFSDEDVKKYNSLEWLIINILSNKVTLSYCSVDDEFETEEITMPLKDLYDWCYNNILII